MTINHAEYVTILEVQFFKDKKSKVSNDHQAFEAAIETTQYSLWWLMAPDPIVDCTWNVFQDHQMVMNNIMVMISA